jgi:hypothetical protein
MVSWLPYPYRTGGKPFLGRFVALWVPLVAFTARMLQETKMPVAGNAAPTSTYRIRSILQLMAKSYNEGDTRDKGKLVVVSLVHALTLLSSR